MECADELEAHSKTVQIKVYSGIIQIKVHSCHIQTRDELRTCYVDSRYIQDKSRFGDHVA